MILGLAGPAGVGKDTVADRLVDMYGFRKVSFAQTLKAMMAVAGFPEPCREQKEELIPGFEFSWRVAAQRLGTEWGRGLDPNIWTKIIEAQISTPGNWVISDVRFANEAEMVRRRGRLVHIYGRITTVTGEAAGHVSEAGVAGGIKDLAISNRWSVARLYLEIDTLIEGLKCV